MLYFYITLLSVQKIYAIAKRSFVYAKYNTFMNRSAKREKKTIFYAK